MLSYISFLALLRFSFLLRSYCAAACFRTFPWRASQAVQIIEEPADGSFDGAGFVTTHSVQKSTGDQGVDVGFGYLKQVAAKSTLPTFAHSLHAERAGAAVFERTGCSCGMRNPRSQAIYKRPTT
jgi:hypothetical protein